MVALRTTYTVVGSNCMETEPPPPVTSSSAVILPIKYVPTPELPWNCTNALKSVPATQPVVSELGQLWKYWVPAKRRPPPPCMLGCPWLSPFARSSKNSMPRTLPTVEAFVALVKYVPSVVQGPNKTSPE